MRRWRATFVAEVLPSPTSAAPRSSGDSHESNGVNELSSAARTYSHSLVLNKHLYGRCPQDGGALSYKVRHV